MKKIIFNADDFGLTSGCNKGIVEAIKNGVVTSTTLMVNMPKAEEAVKLAKENGIISFGIHLTLTCGKPILSGKEVPSLVDERGIFYKRTTSLCPAMNLEEAERELRAQINKFFQIGINLSHMDGHHHIHMYDGVREIVANLAKEYNVPLRSSNIECKKLYDEIGIKTTDYFTWDFYGEKATLDNLKSIINDLDHGTTEIMCHPAFCDEELEKISSYNKNRAEELKILKSEELKEWLVAENIELITFKDLGD
ncbi:chitin disaccharide deacetylase [uncultured Clostridium sp.]|uniref:chitin disaccharide deacetylase n=1 Tax=uncultured Clostridium sp. TaxID=59620 RepID=UPI0028EAF5B2|nr:chitin disaccharide deacetylase [uncultured Clostridium sp.]